MREQHTCKSVLSLRTFLIDGVLCTESKFEAQASKREHEEKEGLEFAQKMMESGAITERDEEEQGKRVREDEALAQKLQAEE